MKYTVEQAAAFVDVLRHVADHIERQGPAVVLDGAANLDIERETISINDHLSGRVVRQLYGPTTLIFKGDLAMRGLPWPTPVFGIRKAFYAGVQYRWDGQPRSAPRKGDFYLSSEMPVCVSRATRDLKCPRFIMTKCS